MAPSTRNSTFRCALTKLTNVQGHYGDSDSYCKMISVDCRGVKCSFKISSEEECRNEGFVQLEISRNSQLVNLCPKCAEEVTDGKYQYQKVLESHRDDVRVGMTVQDVYKRFPFLKCSAPMPKIKVNPDSDVVTAVISADDSSERLSLTRSGGVERSQSQLAGDGGDAVNVAETDGKDGGDVSFEDNGSDKNMVAAEVDAEMHDSSTAQNSSTTNSLAAFSVGNNATLPARNGGSGQDSSSENNSNGDEGGSSSPTPTDKNQHDSTSQDGSDAHSTDGTVKVVVTSHINGKVKEFSYAGGTTVGFVRMAVDRSFETTSVLWYDREKGCPAPDYIALAEITVPSGSPVKFIAHHPDWTRIRGVDMDGASEEMKRDWNNVVLWLEAGYRRCFSNRRPELKQSLTTLFNWVKDIINGPPVPNTAQDIAEDLAIVAQCNTLLEYIALNWSFLKQHEMAMHLLHPGERYFGSIFNENPLIGTRQSLATDAVIENNRGTSTTLTASTASANNTENANGSPSTDLATDSSYTKKGRKNIYIEFPGPEQAQKTYSCPCGCGKAFYHPFPPIQGSVFRNGKAETITCYLPIFRRENIYREAHEDYKSHQGRVTLYSSPKDRLEVFPFPKPDNLDTQSLFTMYLHFLPMWVFNYAYCRRCTDTQLPVQYENILAGWVSLMDTTNSSDPVQVAAYRQTYYYGALERLVDDDCRKQKCNEFWCNNMRKTKKMGVEGGSKKDILEKLDIDDKEEDRLRTFLMKTAMKACSAMFKALKHSGLGADFTPPKCILDPSTYNADAVINSLMDVLFFKPREELELFLNSPTNAQSKFNDNFIQSFTNIKSDAEKVARDNAKIMASTMRCHYSDVKEHYDEVMVTIGCFPDQQNNAQN